MGVIIELLEKITLFQKETGMVLLLNYIKENKVLDISVRYISKYNRTSIKHCFVPLTDYDSFENCLGIALNQLTEEIKDRKDFGNEQHNN